MPLYVYTCNMCGAEIEIYCKVEERMGLNKTVCPECREGVLEKSPFNKGGFRLSDKGNVGWANDGYATTYGDAENFKARAKNKPLPFTD